MLRAERGLYSRRRPWGWLRMERSPREPPSLPKIFGEQELESKLLRWELCSGRARPLVKGN